MNDFSNRRILLADDTKAGIGIHVQSLKEDCITKPFDTSEGNARVKTHLSLKIDQEEFSSLIQDAETIALTQNEK